MNSPLVEELRNHQAEALKWDMRDVFEQDPHRFEKFHVKFIDGFLLDYSKNLINEKTLELLFKLARSADVEGWRHKMFSGEHINITEKRSVLHVALRADRNSRIVVDGEDIVPLVHSVLDKMEEFVGRVRSGEWKGYTGT
jgi:glucose-6-phosphate isomerase